MTASTTPGLVGTALWGGTQLTEHAGNLKAEVMGAPPRSCLSCLAGPSSRGQGWGPRCRRHLNSRWLPRHLSNWQQAESVRDA